MDLALKVFLAIIGFLTVDRLLLFYEKLYFAKHGRLVIEFDEAEKKDYEKR